MLSEEPLERIVERFDAWYENDLLDRPPMTFLGAWRHNGERVPLPPQKQHADAREARLDARYRVQRFADNLPNMVFIADTVPSFRPEVAADEAAVLYGGDLRFNERSTWALHTTDDIRQVLEREPDYAHPIWCAILDMCRLSCEQSQGRWLTNINIHDYVADCLVALRGPEELCYDVMDDPEGVRLACLHVAAGYRDRFDQQYSLISEQGLPTGFEGEVGYGRHNRMGCDFLCMISPAMAAETIYPALAMEMEHLDRCYFHLDSEGALPHLEWLLQQPKVKGIQWVYGANRGPACKWLDVYRQIQSSGRSIELLPTSVEDARQCMRALRPEGVWFKSWGWNAEQAHLLVEVASDLSKWNYAK